MINGPESLKRNIVRNEKRNVVIADAAIHPLPQDTPK